MFYFIAVVFGYLSAALVFAVDVFEFFAEEGGLYFVESAVEALVLVDVFLFAAIISQCADGFGQLVVIGGYGTGVAQGAEIFAWVEGVAGSVAQRSCSFWGLGIGYWRMSICDG